MVELKFVNRTSYVPGVEADTDVMQVAPEACKRIIQWYGSYCAGDDYTVTIDGVEQELDLNGELVGPLEMENN